MATKKSNEKADDAYDKKRGIKEGTKRDSARDKKAGLPMDKPGKRS